MRASIDTHNGVIEVQGPDGVPRHRVGEPSSA